jgi:hypothetical protein
MTTQPPVELRHQWMRLKRQPHIAEPHAQPQDRGCFQQMRPDVDGVGIADEQKALAIEGLHG